MNPSNLRAARLRGPYNEVDMDLPTFSIRSALVALATTASLAGAQSAVVRPVDEATRQPDLVAFRNELLASLARNDTAAVLAKFSPEVKLDFGGGEGIELLRERLREGELWRALEDVLANGGRFLEDSTFYAPWWFHVDTDDPVEQWVVIGDGVRVRAEPRAESGVVATLSYMVVMDDTAAAPDVSADWVAIRLKDGRRGFVAARFVRRTFGYRVGIRREGGQWRIIYFIAGD